MVQFYALACVCSTNTPAFPWLLGVFGWVFLVLGVAALFLAAVGLYGVMSFAVTGLLASLVPARRVTRVDPITALTPE